MYQLVKATTLDNHILSGLFIESAKENPLIIYIHGFEGDFYSHKFINDIATEFKAQNLSFQSVQTRGTGSESELIKSDFSWTTAGSHFELLEDAYKDIDAWCEFANQKGYKNIILTGHSLGTIKVCRYLIEVSYADQIKKLL